MKPEQFLRRCPTLWHVGPAGSWEGIKRVGLRTAEQLINRAAALDDDERSRLLTQPRRTRVTFTVEGSSVSLRDQEPRRRTGRVTLLPGLAG